MVEYGEGVGQAGKVAGSGQATGGGTTDVGASLAASLTDALNHTSAALGVPPSLLALVLIAMLLLVAWFVFAR